MIRVLAVDDNDIVLQGLLALLAHGEDIEVVGTASNGQEAINESERLRPDVVLLDVRMPVTDGITAAARISKRTKVLMLTSADDRKIVAGAIRAGAHGYLVHGNFDVWELASAIRLVHAGESVLSPAATGPLMALVRGEAEDDDKRRVLSAREREVMELVVSGLSNPVIAERMFVSEKTVKNHINRIYAKLGAANRAEAVATWTTHTLAQTN